MNEKSKIFVVFGFIIALVIVIIGYNIKVANASEKVYEQFVSDMNSSEEKMIVIGREGCSWCQLFRPILDYYANKYDISYSYIDVEKLIDRDFKKILEKVEESSIGTPFTVFVKDGKITDKIDGYADECELFEILQKHGFVAEDEELSLNYLDFDSLKKTIKSKQRTVIVVGQKYCSYCIRFKPILMKIADENKAQINYINYDEIEEQKELNEYLSDFKVFQGDWGTPLTIVVENGKIVSTLSGYAEEGKFLQFLQNNELLKSEVE